MNSAGSLVQRIAWSGLVQGIMGIHVWSFNTIEHGVLVKTHESWDGELVEAQAKYLQHELDKSIRSWLESLKLKAESMA